MGHERSHDRANPISWCIALSLICVVGCETPIDAPSAYTGEQFLCGDEQAAEFDGRVAQCREANLRDKSCAGFVSLKGDIDSRHVVVDSTVFDSTYLGNGWVTSDGAILWQLNFKASSPYFAFRMTVSGMPLDEGTRELPGACRDNQGFLYVEVRGGSDLFPMYFSSCDLKLRTPEEEMRVAFSASLGGRGSATGCFHVFPTVM